MKLENVKELNNPSEYFPIQDLALAVYIRLELWVLDVC